MTPEEFISKVDYEGGPVAAMLYGLKVDDLDDSDPVLKSAWVGLHEAWAKFKPAHQKFERAAEWYWS